jgi:CRISPR/Cas system-associated exonuclease Cas4 (RecB family)
MSTKTPHADYDSYNLFEHVDRYMTSPRFAAPSRGGHFYPSEASVKYEDNGEEQVAGACLRKSYYRIKHGDQRGEVSARGAHIMQHGRSIEESLTEVFKQMGIWRANSVRFKDNEFNISGEIDVVLVEPDGTEYGAEVKTAYGYMAEKDIIGNTYQNGKPKASHLLQTLIYCYVFRDRLPYFRILYMFRDSCSRRTFKVELHEEDGLYYPKIDGVISKKFTIQDVLNRYKELQYYLDNEILPPRDFQLEYTDEKVEKLYKLKKISKSKYEKHFAPRKPQKAGDWECSYCDFKRFCWEEDPEESLVPDSVVEIND